MHIIVGVQVGYHLVESREDQILVPQHPNDEPNERKSNLVSEYSVAELRTGFSVVIPIERVFNMIESPEVQQGMKLGIERVRSKSGYRPSSVPLPNNEKPAKSGLLPIEGDEQHKERFTALLDEAVGKQKQGG